MDERMIKVEFIKGELQFSFKLNTGEILVCNYEEAQKVMKQIEKGEIKIISMEL